MLPAQLLTAPCPVPRCSQLSSWAPPFEQVVRLCHWACDRGSCQRMWWELSPGYASRQCTTSNKGGD